MSDILKPYLGDERSSWFTLDGADADLIDDLRSVGVNVGSRHFDETPEGVAEGAIFELPGEQGASDAAASQMMRLIMADDAELDRITAAMDAEIELITARYRTIADPVSRRRASKASIVEHIAAQAFAPDAKKRSRATPYGTFGVRKLPERFEIIDPNSLLAWARLHAPEIITKPEPKERILQKDAEGAVRALYDADEPERIIPLTGCRIVPEVPAAPFFKLTATP